MFNTACITPLVKKFNFDPAYFKSYWPISKLLVLSKLLERLVARQLIDHLAVFKLLAELQSAYRAHYLTETAVLKVLSDILCAVDSSDLAVLTLLYLSAACDTVDHATLLRRHTVTYGVGSVVINWFTLYLDGRTQSVHCGLDSWKTLTLFSVPQGSVPGPIMFLLYSADLLRLIEIRNFDPHLYADDTVSAVLMARGTDELHGRFSHCVIDVVDVIQWIAAERLEDYLRPICAVRDLG